MIDEVTLKQRLLEIVAEDYKSLTFRIHGLSLGREVRQALSATLSRFSCF